MFTPEKTLLVSDSTGPVADLGPSKNLAKELDKVESSDDDEENEGSFSYVDLKYQFLKDYEEFKSAKKGGKKRGRNTSSPNSETKNKSNKKKQQKKNH